jgi:hypothetical protein
MLPRFERDSDDAYSLFWSLIVSHLRNMLTWLLKQIENLFNISFPVTHLNTVKLAALIYSLSLSFSFSF